MSEETNPQTAPDAPEATAAPEAAAAPEATAAPAAPAEPEVQEEISYHAVQKDGTITAIWEMRGRKHVRTIDPRSDEGRHLLGPHEQENQTEGAH